MTKKIKHRKNTCFKTAAHLIGRCTLRVIIFFPAQTERNLPTWPQRTPQYIKKSN